MKPIEALMYALVEKLGKEFVPATMLKEFETASAEARSLIRDNLELSRWVGKKIGRIDTWQGVLQPPEEALPVLSVVSEALYSDRIIDIRYLAERGESRKQVRPLALLERDQVHYAVFRFSGYADARLVALHRVLEAHVVDHPEREIDGTFDLDGFLADGLPFTPSGGEALDLRLSLAESTHRTFSGRPLRGTASVSPPADGWFEVEANAVPNTMELRWWLLGLGSKVRIRAPEFLAQELQHLLNDPLTGLLTRGTCRENLHMLLAAARRTGRPGAVALIDVDHFKRFNDELGHAAGDVVLREVARRIKAACRASDSVGRWGGEEFLVLLPDTDLEEASILSERLREAVAAQPFVVDAHGTTRYVTVSIGVAVADQMLVGDAKARTDKGESVVVCNADRALYKAKRLRNCVEVFAGA